MPCASCAERRKLIAEAREAYQRGDMPEVKRLLREVFGATAKDVDRLFSAIVGRQP